MSKLVIAKCNNCGIVATRRKGRSGLGHTIAGQYCGTMRILEWVKE